MIEKIREEIKKYFVDVNPCHDMMHTERVMSLARHIAEKEGADLEIVELSALLHDVARKIQDESQGKICHAEKGAEMAREILARHGYPLEKIEQVVHGIATHRFRSDKIPQTPEAKVLSDADNLDAIGAIGIGRAFSFSGHRGSFVHISDFDSENPAEEYGPRDCAYREFSVKLKKIKDKMFTDEGKRIAAERHEFMVEFFNRIQKEVQGDL